ncbi:MULTISPECIES: c-type cytochrome biogenesis protein CcmI [Methylorubrum]|uniref:C-type cytochrome biogenesis protein CcmI n=2 Tax=Methylorubrum rhodesianum TaxID=29427 RepID=A0ABU9Z9J0_9HYPH|nr:MULTISPECIES: c-type cytochrome biogenesis protein CcmI [Methylorubrum]MBI1691917.1 c-type cytochrome biogenesis protein CcmI [Methylorubrum sp. DB1722]MBK3402462.1 c-type cytochrome biogenesis protein CcmI [Methylorubrum rhodesianum]MBY0142389.1 c-type cytochrome biogenesis protein CcmI [Methylorubrum populi]
MTAIWFILAAMTGAAVFALLWPMSRRRRQGAAPEAAGDGLATETGFYEDQLAEIERDLGRGLIAPAEAEAARAEAARRLLRASREERADASGAAPIAEPHLRQRRAASAFALSTIPLVALVVYGLYGSPNLPSQTDADRKATRAGAQDLMTAIGQIEARLANHPDDARGWSVLGPVYMRLGRFDDAARAYAALVRLKGEDAQALSDWGEALVAAADGTVSPEARKVLGRALAADPKAAKPQFYLARGDEQSGDVAGAVRRLEAMAAAAPADAPWLPTVRDNLARLKGETAAEPKAEGNGEGPKVDAPVAGPGSNIQALPPSERIDAIRGMVEGLERRLAKQGGSADEWLRLVRSHAVLGERDKALDALERARKAFRDDREALARFDAQAHELGLPGAGAPPKPEAGDRTSDKPGDKPAAEPDAAAAAIKAMPPAEREAAIRGMVASLDRRLAAKGGSADEWMRLVRSYGILGDRAAAAQALDRAKMALAANPTAVERLDALGKELGLSPVQP